MRSFEGWYNVCWRVSCYFPGITLLALTVLNLLIHHTGSSGAIPLGAFFSLVSLWFVVSIPLCFSGAASLASNHIRKLLTVVCEAVDCLLKSHIVQIAQQVGRLGPAAGPATACCNATMFSRLITRASQRRPASPDATALLSRCAAAHMLQGLTLSVCGCGRQAG